MTNIIAARFIACIGGFRGVSVNPEYSMLHVCANLVNFLILGTCMEQNMTCVQIYVTLATSGDHIMRTDCC